METVATSSAIGPGGSLSEAVLWVSWFHTGTLIADKHSVLLEIRADSFAKVVAAYEQPYRTCVCYANKFVDHMASLGCGHGGVTDLTEFDLDWDDLGEWMPTATMSDDHFIFLSHFKGEAGTEAALLLEAMTRNIREDRAHPAHAFKQPVFLDSENLQDLAKLQDHVLRTHNLVLLLTPSVLSRPWCLIEIVTACRLGICVVPVEIKRPGLEFIYPDESFYRDFRNGHFLSESAQYLLDSESISLEQAAEAIKQVFSRISIDFSPHKSQSIRAAEVGQILDRCQDDAQHALARRSIQKQVLAYESTDRQSLPEEE
eukprot:TRINITY_DN14790_c0_g1_i2.p1 TRINITY_DN14790_c0_g1~~TRINITY_DN14790_c0_g1_i2.p1  ORF type:complete len:347 (-),score=52.20 TRINITY_DN14790_c0_g1_i2:112-1056(-)